MSRMPDIPSQADFDNMDWYMEEHIVWLFSDSGKKHAVSAEITPYEAWNGLKGWSAGFAATIRFFSVSNVPSPNAWSLCGKPMYPMRDKLHFERTVQAAELCKGCVRSREYKQAATDGRLFSTVRTGVTEAERAKTILREANL